LSTDDYARHTDSFIETMHAVHAGLTKMNKRDPDRLIPERLLIHIAHLQVEVAALRLLLVKKGVLTLEEAAASEAEHAKLVKECYEYDLKEKLACPYGHAPVAAADDDGS
jgi:hypothetical protein